MKNNQNGVLVLLALVMTMVLIVASIVLATITIRQARLSTSADQGQVAFYAAQSIAEQALYDVTANGVDPIDFDGASGSLPNGANWRSTQKTETDIFNLEFLPLGASDVINLYNKSNANGAAGASGLDFSWSSGDFVDVQLRAWDGATLAPATTETLTCSSSPCSDNLILNPSYAYEVRIIASSNAVAGLDVSTNPAGTLVSLPITITVVGEYQGAEQSIEVELTERPPWNEPPATCGNGGPPETGEQCDDGNLVNGDGCSDMCMIETADCKNGIQEVGETCDDGNIANTGVCNATCTGPTSCGDGIIQNPNGNGGNESCDELDGSNAGLCLADCSGPTFCGDGTTQSPNGNGQNEQCDDNNTNNGDGCSSSCQVEVGSICGNGGAPEPGEACEDGNTSNGDGCSSSCTIEQPVLVQQRNPSICTNDLCKKLAVSDTTTGNFHLSANKFGVKTTDNASYSESHEYALSGMEPMDLTSSKVVWTTGFGASNYGITDLNTRSVLWSCNDTSYADGRPSCSSGGGHAQITPAGNEFWYVGSNGIFKYDINSFARIYYPGLTGLAGNSVALDIHESSGDVYFIEQSTGTVHVANSAGNWQRSFNIPAVGTSNYTDIMVLSNTVWALNNCQGCATDVDVYSLTGTSLFGFKVQAAQEAYSIDAQQNFSNGIVTVTSGNSIFEYSCPGGNCSYY